MVRSKGSVLKEAWAITRPYWFSEERWVARGLLIAIVAMNLIDVGINVRLNSWRNDFYNALQNYDEAAFFYQLGLFAVLAGAYIVIFVYALYLQQMLQIRWRRWMTEVYLREWLADETYYRLQLKGDGTDNPDQRIAEDLSLFPNQTLNLSLGLLTSVVQAVSFSFILWDLSGPLELPLGGWGTSRSQAPCFGPCSSHGGCDSARHLARPAIDQAEFRPTALGSGFSFQPGPAARTPPERCVLRRRSPRVRHLFRPLRQGLR